MNQIYLNINDQNPYEVEAVNQMLLTNEISLETLAWKQGMDNWESLTCDTFKLLGVLQHQLINLVRYRRTGEILRKRIKY